MLDRPAERNRVDDALLEELAAAVEADAAEAYAARGDGRAPRFTGA